MVAHTRSLPNPELFFLINRFLLEHLLVLLPHPPPHEDELLEVGQGLHETLARDGAGGRRPPELPEAPTLEEALDARLGEGGGEVLLVAHEEERSGRVVRGGHDPGMCEAGEIACWCLVFSTSVYLGKTCRILNLFKR